MKKLIFFDLDGTLSPTNSWNLFNIHFGLTEQEDELLLDWYKRGLITYGEWDEFITKILREKNLCTKDAVDVFVKTIPLRSEAQNLITTCKNKGYTPILLSGTLKQIAESIGERIGIELVYTCSEAIFREDGNFEDIINDKNESIAKLRMFEAVCKEHGTDPQETIMVGDGSNDLEIFKKTKKAIQIGEHSELQKYAWKHIVNLNEINELI